MGSRVRLVCIGCIQAMRYRDEFDTAPLILYKFIRKGEAKQPHYLKMREDNTSLGYVISLIEQFESMIFETVEQLYGQMYSGRRIPKDLLPVPVLYVSKDEAHRTGQPAVWKVGLVSSVVDVDEITQQSSSNILLCHINCNGVINSLTTERCIFYQGKWKRFSELPAAV